MPKIRRIFLFLSPLAFVVVFFSLISQKGPVNPVLKNAGLLFLLLCAVVFIVSLILTIWRLIRELSAKVKVANKQPAGIYPTRLEFIIRKVLAVLIIIIGITFGLMFIFYIPLAILVGLYIFFRKRYFLLTDIFIVLIGALLYYENLPFFGPDAGSMKMFILGVTAGPLFAVFLIGKILILVAGIILVASGILSRFKIFRDSPKRGLVVFYMFIAITGILIVPLLFQPMRVILNDQQGQLGENCAERYAFPNETREVTVDALHKIWIYHWSAKNVLNEKVSILGITGSKPGPKLFSLLRLLPEKVTIAPPFGQQIEVSGAQKSAVDVTVEPGATFNMRIISPDPLYGLIIPIGNLGNTWCSLAYGFLMPGRDVESISEAPDPQVRFYTIGVQTSSSPPAEQTTFHSGEIILPGIIGLKKGTVYGFQITDQSGQSVIPLDIDSSCTSVGTDTVGGCGGAFNDKDRPLDPGTYDIQLIRIAGGKGLIIAKTRIVITAAK